MRCLISQTNIHTHIHKAQGTEGQSASVSWYNGHRHTCILGSVNQLFLL